MNGEITTFATSNKYFYSMKNEVLQKYPTISLDEMKDVRLLNRIDTKYVTTTERLERFLQLAQGDYYVQVIDGECQLPYHTIYLDTPDLGMYMAHHDGRQHRYKVRMRRYEVSGLSFMEVKDKTNRGRTKKSRIEIDNLIYKGKMRDFVDNQVPYAADSLSPTIENRFRRITLVNKQKTERLTIDMDLQFHNLLNDNHRELKNNVVIELKRDGNVFSPATNMLRDLHIHPCGFSKMAMGMALTMPTLKQNNFKERIHYIEKLKG